MNVFCTSVTGMVGANLVDDLLSQKNNVFCIARPKLGESPRARAKKALALTGFKSRSNIDLLRVFEGDVTRPLLGLSMSDMLYLKERGIQALYHTAGSVNFSENESDKKRTIEINYGGLKNVLKLADFLGIRDIHYVGTAYSDGNANVLSYGISKKKLPRFNNPYEMSKNMAEEYLLSYLKKNPQKRAFIYKPSIIVGDFSKGRIINTSGYYRYMKVFQILKQRLLLEKGVWDENFSSDSVLTIPIEVPGCFPAEINIVSIDYVLGIIGAITEIDVAGVYPIVNENPPIYGNLLEFGMRFFEIEGVSTSHDGRQRPAQGEYRKFQQMVSRGVKSYLPYISQTFAWDLSFLKEVVGSRYQSHPVYGQKEVSLLLSFALARDFDIKV